MTKVLFLGCNNSQIEYLKELNKKGFYVIGTDQNINAPGRELCNKFYNCGYNDFDSLIEIGKEENFKSSDKIFIASSQFAYLGAAVFAESVDIEFPSSENIGICLEKTKFYEYFSKINVPIPKTKYISNEKQLMHEMQQIDKGWFWLKSDFSKNPNHVYRLHSSSDNFENINWSKDRYFKEKYILQPEHSGVALRFNLYGDRFNVFDFQTGLLTHKYHSQIEEYEVLSSLRRIIDGLDLNNWLIKFDVILEKEAYVVLDIGLEPPYRMRQLAILNNIDFSKHYIQQYLFGPIEYPSSLD